MSKFLEVREGLLVNLDNIKTVGKMNAINGGKPSLLISYMDCTGTPLVFQDRNEMHTAYNRIKDSNKE
jgi:hypothetical protein